VINQGDSVTFWCGDDIGIRGVRLNSSGWFQESEPLEGGASYIQSWNRPGGGTVTSRSYFVYSYGDPTNYTLGFLSSGWLTSSGSTSISGFGFLPANWTVQFNEGGPFRIADVNAGDCPSYAGADCYPTMTGGIYVVAAPEPSSASGFLLPLWGLTLVLASYF